MDLGLRGRTILITGASKGIGRACAHAFAAEGAELALVARSGPDLEQTAGELRAEAGVAVRTHALDLSTDAGQHQLAEEVGPIDVLVNNAGAIPGGTLQSVDDETWRQAWDLKVFGYINLCRLLLPRLEEQGRGVVVNVIGSAGLRPQPSYLPGGAGNAALMALTQALGSRSLRQGVRVVGVNPGLVLTDRLATLFRAGAEAKWGDGDRWSELVPEDPPPARPDQVADVVTFLASARAGHITGCVVPVDGGGSAR